MNFEYKDNLEIINIPMTKEEAEVVTNYLLERRIKLENCGLEDSYCYPKITSVYYNISDRLNSKNKEPLYYVAKIKGAKYGSTYVPLPRTIYLQKDGRKEELLSLVDAWQKDYSELLELKENINLKEKAFELIMLKNVDVNEIRPNATAEGYNSKIPYYRRPLTDEEFKFLKEVVHRLDCNEILFEIPKYIK